MTGKAQTRGDDASDHAPRPKAKDGNADAKDKQGAPNTDEKARGRDAIDVEDVSSANDEGAD